MSEKVGLCQPASIFLFLLMSLLKFMLFRDMSKFLLSQASLKEDPLLLGLVTIVELVVV